jgi:parvulin-like peptidyl-prolyl isomerase
LAELHLKPMFSFPTAFPNRARRAALITAGGLLLAGCPDPNIAPSHSPAPEEHPVVPATTGPSSSAVVATIEDMSISQSDLDAVMNEAYGLKMLFELVELDLGKKALQEKGMTLTPTDVDRERELIFSRIFNGAARESWETLLQQFLDQQKLTRTEFDIKIIQTRACLRKIVEPQVRGKIPELAIHRGFRQMFGAKMRIRDIELPDLAAVAQARNRLLSEPFDQVAKEMSTDLRTRDRGGEWEPFAVQDASIPEVIRDTAFSINVGDVSGDLQVGVHYHIIKVIEAIDPKLVTFEQERATVTQVMEDRLIDDSIHKMQLTLQQVAEAQINIDDPGMKKQWDALLGGQKKTLDRTEVSRRIESQRPTTFPTTSPVTSPTPSTLPSALPPTLPSVVRPTTTP